MYRYAPTRLLASVAAAAALMEWPRLADAATVAPMPIVIGNGWLALGLVVLFVVVVYMLIRGTMHVEERDARLGRRRSDDGGWIGYFNAPDDDDDIHHHGGHGHG